MNESWKFISVNSPKSEKGADTSPEALATGGVSVRTDKPPRDPRRLFVCPFGLRVSRPAHEACRFTIARWGARGQCRLVSLVAYPVRVVSP